jgi:hypothetical protein
LNFLDDYHQNANENIKVLIKEEEKEKEDEKRTSQCNIEHVTYFRTVVAVSIGSERTVSSFVGNIA